MKTFFTIIVTIWSISLNFAQNCSFYNDSKFTEYYNHLFAKSYFRDPLNSTDPLKDVFSWNYKGNTYKLPAQPDSSHCYSAFGSLENGARLIESLLVMYETTHDKAYLHWAMDLSVHWISMRGIGRGNTSYSERNSFGSINHICN